MSKHKIKIALISPRYGLDVTGGAEMLVRLIAEHLSKFFKVTVITTKAKDYITWKDFYKKNNQVVNGVRVLRFSVDKPRNIQEFNQLSAYVLGQKQLTKDEQIDWLKKEGPYSTSMFDYIKKHKNDYDLFMFAPYLYASTCFGILPVIKKSILIPAAHDEPYLYLPIFKNIFNKCQTIITNTPEEASLIKKTFKRQQSIFTIGVGLENYPKLSQSKTNNYLKRFKLKKPYMLYLGRIEAGKGLDQLFYFFDKYKQTYCNDLELVLAGKNSMSIPSKNYIKFLGFVSLEEKYSLIHQCRFLVNPSPYESLSLIVLEAWSQKKPVLVNGNCQVLKGQVCRAQAGLYYTTEEEFLGMINWFNKNKSKSSTLGKNGYRYLEKNYSWAVIESKFIKAIKQALKSV